MHARRAADAADFLESTHALRGSDPVRMNVIGSVAEGVASGRRYERENWFVVEDAGRVVGAAVWTLPYKLVLGPMAVDAAREVGRAASEVGATVPGISGPEAECRAAAEGLGVRTRLGMRERILVLRDYVAPPRVEGRPRRPRIADLGLMARWYDDFARDADTFIDDSRVTAAGNRTRTWFWEVDDVPVAMAGHAPIVSTPGGDVGRVGPVFTPADLRGRGYGTAVTAVVTEHLLPVVGTVMLYTDAGNPTSNAIYERLGYVHEHDIVELVPDPT